MVEFRNFHSFMRCYIQTTLKEKYQPVMPINTAYYRKTSAVADPGGDEGDASPPPAHR